MAWVNIDVDVKLDEFNDQELIDELEGRGHWRVVELNESIIEDLTSEEIEAIVEVFQYALVGTIRHSIYEKLRKR